VDISRYFNLVRVEAGVSSQSLNVPDKTPFSKEVPLGTRFIRKRLDMEILSGIKVLTRNTLGNPIKNRVKREKKLIKQTKNLIKMLLGEDLLIEQTLE